MTCLGRETTLLLGKPERFGFKAGGSTAIDQLQRNGAISVLFCPEIQWLVPFNTTGEFRTIPGIAAQKFEKANLSLQWYSWFVCYSTCAFLKRNITKINLCQKLRHPKTVLPRWTWPETLVPWTMPPPGDVEVWGCFDERFVWKVMYPG